MMRGLIVTLIVILLLISLGGVLMFDIGRPFIPSTTATSTSDANPTPSIPDSTATNPGSLITITSVKEHDTITSPLIIKGQARGPWYFEATFPIQLKDANGRLLVESYGQATGEWMTADFVPFETTLTFTKPTTTTGTLIFMNANPSGEPDKDMRLEIPVTFAQ
jgi:hypothetical protein